MDYIRQYSLNMPDKIIFHCALSQIRGPKCAQRFVTLRNDSAEMKKEQEVLVLRGGFVEWQEKYKKDPMLVENYDEAYWKANPY